MNFAHLAVVLLCTAAGLFAVSAACEREALHQMAMSNFHHVQLIRFGRNMRIPAMLCVVGYLLVCMTAAPAAGTTTVLLASLITMCTQAQFLMHGQAAQVFLRGMVPSLLGLTTLANLAALPLPSYFHGLGLPTAAVGLAFVAGALSWLTAAYRTEQDIVAIRD